MKNMNRFSATRILGVSDKATIEEIKQAYRLLAKEYHPDQNSDHEANATFIQIKAAYDYLINNHNNSTHEKNKNKDQTNSKTKQQEEPKKEYEEHKENKENQYNAQQDNHSQESHYYEPKINLKNVFKRIFNIKFNFVTISLFLITSLIFALIIVAMLNKPVFLAIHGTIYHTLLWLESGYIVIFTTLTYMLFNLNNFKWGKLILVNLVVITLLIVTKVMLMQVFNTIKMFV